MSVPAVIVTPPISPNHHAPPLGPAVLKAHVEGAGLACDTIDLNLPILAGAGWREASGHLSRDALQRARELVEMHLHLPRIAPERVPSCDDQFSSLPHSFEEIERALSAIDDDEFWRELLAEHLFDRTPPAILGLSVMGPAQVVPALLIARLANRQWPDTVIVVGGSHITLLKDRIAADARFAAGAIDYFAAGHAEDVFARAVHALAAGGTLPKQLFRAGSLLPAPAAPDVPADERLAPSFEEHELEFFSTRDDVELPVQLGRGCAYGRCTYCTYPAVEEFEHVPVARLAARLLPPLLSLEPARVQVVDSLLTLRSMEAFGSVMARQPAPVPWTATSKISKGMTAARMARLASQGCTFVEVGLETIHPATQRLFDKLAPLAVAEQAVATMVEAGIAVEVNMIYGAPGETIDMAYAQLAWWQGWKRRYPDLIFGTHSMLQLDHGSPLITRATEYGLRATQAGPWSFTYIWNAPPWREAFAADLRDRLGGREQ